MSSTLNAGEKYSAATLAIIENLQICMRRHFGAKVVVENVSQATLGGSNRTLLFDLVDGGQVRRLVSRQETYHLDNSPFLAPEIQFKLLQLAFANHLPVPEPIIEFAQKDGLGRGHVISCVLGETLPKRLLQAPEFALARNSFCSQAGQFLARLHAIDPADAQFVATSADSMDPLQAQMARYEYYAEAHPALDFAFRWLEKNRPEAKRRCLVHGDFRNGNMIINEQGIAAVLDWECSHLSDPLEDLGWLCTRSWRFGNNDLPVGGFGPRAALFAAYEEAGGQTVDESAVKWWEIFGLLRWAMLNIMQVHGHLSGNRRSPAFAACGRNTSLIEHDLLLTISGRID